LRRGIETSQVSYRKSGGKKEKLEKKLRRREELEREETGRVFREVGISRGVRSRGYISYLDKERDKGVRSRWTAQHQRGGGKKREGRYTLKRTG